MYHHGIAFGPRFVRPTIQAAAAESAARTVAPRTDVLDGKEEVLVIADMPGVAREALEVHIEEGLLRLQGVRTRNVGEGVEPERLTYLLRFRLPDGIDTERVSADLRDGVLTVHLPKLAALRPRKVEISVA